MFKVTVSDSSNVFSYDHALQLVCTLPLCPWMAATVTCPTYRQLASFIVDEKCRGPSVEIGSAPGIHRHIPWGRLRASPPSATSHSCRYYSLRQFVFCLERARMVTGSTGYRRGLCPENSHRT